MNDQIPVPENFPKDQDELNRIIQNVLAPKLQKIESLEAEKDQLSKDKESLGQQVADRDATIKGHESSIAERDRRLLVASVAHQKGVPARWLSGDTEEELTASADEFLADVKNLGGVQGGASEAGTGSEGGQGENGKPAGHVASAGTGGEKPPRPTYDEIVKKAYEQAKTH